MSPEARLTKLEQQVLRKANARRLEQLEQKVKKLERGVNEEGGTGPNDLGFDIESAYAQCDVLLERGRSLGEINGCYRQANELNCASIKLHNPGIEVPC